MGRGQYVTKRSMNVGITKAPTSAKDNLPGSSSTDAQKDVAGVTVVKKEPLDVTKHTTGSIKKTPARKEKGPRKRHRWHAGTVALRQIRKFQKSTEPLMPMAVIRRLIYDALVLEGKNRGLTNENGPARYQITKSAVDAISEASNAFLSELLGEAGIESIKAGRVTLQLKDLKEAVRLHVTHETMGRRRRNAYTHVVEQNGESQSPSNVDGKLTGTSKADVEEDNAYVPQEVVVESESDGTEAYSDAE